MNFAQPTKLVWDECHDSLAKFEISAEGEPDYPSADERRRAFAFWGARTIIDTVDEVAVFDGSGGFARLDAWCFSYSKQTAEYELASDIPIERPVTKASLALYEYRLKSGLEFVRGAVGIVRARRGIWERVTAKNDKEVSRFRAYLMPFDGWTVAINEKDARAALKDIGPSVASRAEVTGEIGPHE